MKDYNSRTNRYIGYTLRESLPGSPSPLHNRSKLKFGKYKGYQVMDILKSCPEYLYWLIHNTSIKVTSDLRKMIDDTFISQQHSVTI